MVEISYWRVLDFALSIGEETIVVAISIPIKWYKRLQMNARGIEEVSLPTNKVDYCLNFIVIEKFSFKYYTKNKVLDLAEKILSNKDIYLGYFRAGQISIGPVNEINEKVKDLFRYPIKVKTDYININEKVVCELIKKFKKS